MNHSCSDIIDILFLSLTSGLLTYKSLQEESHGDDVEYDEVEDVLPVLLQVRGQSVVLFE